MYYIPLSPISEERIKELKELGYELAPIQLINKKDIEQVIPTRPEIGLSIDERYLESSETIENGIYKT